MKSTNIILNLLPTELQKMLENKDIENVLTYFMSNDISDEKLAFYLSNLANQINTIEYHEMVASIYHFHFNYVDSAYDLAYYHYWQSLEISQFKDQNLLNEFLEILDEPDFDMITKENIKMVANKVLEKDPKNDIAMKYVKS
ncbi:hypothetical protein [Staphylococcus delphini]|uniref:Genomic island nu Sa alpha2 n=1 Tax=Staphylococcus delphini TaxID=53344 RepID=A0AAX0QSL7_9STAP|nr:hypothetical protein [Staphylococcus delphini]PCF34304.1 hypothetical protein B5C00_05390 [Staphylococcus delphini]PCF48242.1 hypothetical protein B5C07_11015 [Staphylococcus delphini]PNZ95577.1 hypothetical protein CD148_03925 [Staphylococcus delphini]RIZ51655.1 hypothetical protein CDL68_09630 [Staphylococcus delphini]VED63404.1 Genomic island nu Sa alpha2 [Staphylococcus delphini]